MKAVLLSAALALAASAVAQVTVTSATFPAPGDTLRFRTDPNPPAATAPTPPGGSQFWDFSGLQGGPVEAVVYRPAAAGTGAASFPGAEAFTEAGGRETYFNITATAFQNLGTSGADPLGLGLSAVVKWGPPLPEGRAPLNFFDIFSSSTNWMVAFAASSFTAAQLGLAAGSADSVRFRRTFQMVEAVDGWGQCQIPGGQFDVLRQKRTTYVSTSVDVKVPPLGWLDISTLGSGGGSLTALTGVDTTTTYHFLSATEKEEIAVLTMSNDQSKVASARFKSLPGAGAAPTVLGEKARLRISPNPVSSKTMVEMRGFAPGSYLLEVHDAAGRPFFSKSLEAPAPPLETDLSGCPPGVLFFQIKGADGRPLAVEKVVKQ